MPHTPGPWRVVTDAFDEPLVKAGEEVVAECYVLDDANLIAAAPLQNEALRMVLSYWLNKRATNEEYRIVFAKVNAAIAAAEGGEA